MNFNSGSNQPKHYDNHRPTKGSNKLQQLEAVDFYGNTALLKACALGNVEAVRVLLSFPVNLHAINYFGQNALTIATYAGCYDTVCELLKHRSYNDFTLSSMIPPLCVAILKDHHRLVELFQTLGPNTIGTRTVHGLSASEVQDMVRVQQHGI